MLVQPLLRNDALLLLVQPDLYAFADVQVEADAAHIGDIESFIKERLKPTPVQPGLIVKDKGKDKGSGAIKLKDDDEEQPEQVRIDKPLILDHQTPKAEIGSGMAVDELSVDVPLDGKHWTMLIRTYRMPKGKMFIVRTFTEASRFPRVKDELKKILDSVQIKPGS